MDRKLRIEFLDNDQVQENRTKFFQSLINREIGFNTPTPFVFDIPDIELFGPNQLWLLRKCLSEANGWNVAGPVCAAHGPMSSATTRYPTTYVWRCITGDCLSVKADTLPFMTATEFLQLGKEFRREVLGEFVPLQPYVPYKSSGLNEYERSRRINYEEPNRAGQIPRTPKGGPFKARWGMIGLDPGDKHGDKTIWNSIDFSQVEARIAAHYVEQFSKNPEAMAHVLPAVIHKHVAEQWGDSPAKKVGSELRQAAKAQNFAMLYGQSPSKEAQEEVNARIEEPFIEREKERNRLLAKLDEEVAHLYETLNKQGELVGRLTARSLSEENVHLLDEAFCFFAGVNFQDHAIAEQRQYLSIMRKLKELMVQLKGKGDDAKRSQ